MYSLVGRSGWRTGSMIGSWMGRNTPREKPGRMGKGGACVSLFVCVRACGCAVGNCVTPPFRLSLPSKRAGQDKSVMADSDKSATRTGLEERKRVVREARTRGFSSNVHTSEGLDPKPPMFSPLPLPPLIFRPCRCPKRSWSPVRQQNIPNPHWCSLSLKRQRQQPSRQPRCDQTQREMGSRAPIVGLYSHDAAPAF